VQQQATTDDKQANILKPDLATDLGTVSDNSKTWKFTLRDGVKWQDGKDITCEDVKYGVSRTYAQDQISGGPNYQIHYLDIPTNADGSSKYKGPYTKIGQDLYDKAVTCEGKTITFHFKYSWPDFAFAAGSLTFLAPFRQDLDKGDKSNYMIFSDGPYKLEGGPTAWQKDKGGTFVRNENYTPAGDEVRKAYPDKIVFTEGLTDEVIAQRLIADNGNDKFAVTDRRVPPPLQPQAFGNPTVKARLTNPVTPYVDYLLPNFRSPRMQNVKVRQALAIATDKSGWITAAGGETAGVPAHSIMSPTLNGYKDANYLNAPDNGDPVKAKALLQEAGVTIPYPITFNFSGGTPTTQKEAAVMKDAWEKAGFKVTLNEQTDTYYDILNDPTESKKWDVCWAGWGADWSSAATVIPPLFDSRINLSEKSNGQDYGWYKNDVTNKAIDDALGSATLDEASTKWQALEKSMVEEVAYIPLLINRWVFLRGSGVKGYINGVTSSTYPDLAIIGVQ